MKALREWYLTHIEEPLDRLPVNWDTLFVEAWCLYAVGILLSGGA